MTMCSMPDCGMMSNGVCLAIAAAIGIFLFPLFSFFVLLLTVVL